MVVVQVRHAGTFAWERLVFERSFWIGNDPSCDIVVEHTESRAVQVVIEEVDVRLECEERAWVSLDNWGVDRAFLHVLHVGNVLDIRRTRIVFELVAGLQADVDRFVTGKNKHVLDETELEFVDALRTKPDDIETLSIYADYLDQHERPLLAELIRLQLLRDSEHPPGNPTAFQSKWLSAQPAAVALRIRDLSPLAEPWWRALIMRRPVVGCMRRYEGCPRWHGLVPTEHANLRTCRECKREVFFCWTLDEIRTHARAGHLVAIDPGLAVRDPESAYAHPNRDVSEEITGERERYDD